MLFCFARASVRVLAATVTAILLSGTVLAKADATGPAQTAAKPPPGLIDAPELGRPGPWPVGTSTQTYRFAGRLHLTRAALATGKVAREDRLLAVRLWYPAAAPGKMTVTYRHLRARPGAQAVSLEMRGAAFAAARPATGERFPLVLISHGYGGWDSVMSNLAESIASRGYVVAAIDHADEPADDPATALVSFGNVLMNRAVDQRLVIARLLDRKARAGAVYAGLIDEAHIGIIGYSMGGYGVLGTAGAEANAASPIFALLPPESKAQILAGDAAMAAKIKAVVAIAPWGNQPENRVYTPASLARLAMPILMIDGDHDDVVDFAGGVSWLFDTMTGADRYLLVYRNALHNVANNAVEIAGLPDFQAAEFLSEPVWRQDRINAINAHFITAFLDVNLKGQSAQARYLDVPTPRAEDGEWRVPPRSPNLGNYAGDGEPRYWRGFQRRWAIGLELRHAARAGEDK